MRPDRPLITPLGDRALTLAFGQALSLEANARAIAAADALETAALPGVIEVVPNLVSVYLSFDPAVTDFWRLSGEIRLAISALETSGSQRETQVLATRYGGDNGPDLAEVAGMLGLSEDAFVARHAAAELRVLAVGFAPGFVYCGLHEDLTLPRRETLQKVPAGTVLFAAGQTAVCATPITTGWWAIGRTAMHSFAATRDPPIILSAGDGVRFEALP